MWCHGDANSHLVRIKCEQHSWDAPLRTQMRPFSISSNVTGRQVVKNVKGLVSLKTWTRGSIKHGHRVSKDANSPVGRSWEPLPLGGNWFGTARLWKRAGRGRLRQSASQEMTVSETSITPTDDGYRKECSLPPLKVVPITNKWEECMHLCFVQTLILLQYLIKRTLSWSA